jgi:hypothetical protein
LICELSKNANMKNFLSYLLFYRNVISESLQAVLRITILDRIWIRSLKKKLDPDPTHEKNSDPVLLFAKLSTGTKM